MTDPTARVLVPVGMLGGGFPAHTVQRGIALGADVIAVDGGSTDSGPYYLATGTPKTTDEAVTRDPRFLVAWCLLSRVHGNIYADGFDHTPARLEMAHGAIENALRLQPDSGEAHLALAGKPLHAHG